MGTKIVLQNMKTGMYFKCPGAWTENFEEAFGFDDHSAAAKFYSGHYLPDVKIIAHTNGHHDDSREM